MTRPAPSGPMRLQKFLSDAGVASRRHAEELILEGRVLVNDQIVDALPAFVDPQHDTVIFDGDVVRPQPLIYFLVHKPTGVVCSNRDPAGRRRAVDFLPPLKQRLFPVGRLDEDTSGLLLMTNDGELAQQITHPRYGVPKVYRAEVRGRVPGDLPQRLKQGVHLSEGKARASEVDVVRRTHQSSILTITLREGRNRQVRRMLAKLGHGVRKLKRLEIGPLLLKGLPVGAARRLMPREVKLLREAVAAARPRPRRRRPAKQSAAAHAAAGKEQQRKPTTARSARTSRRSTAEPGQPTTRRRIIT